MINFDEGRPTQCGRVTWGMNVGFILEVKRDTYRVRWLDGAETTHLRPDDVDEAEDVFSEAAE